MESSNPNGLLPLYEKIRQVGREVKLQEALLTTSHLPEQLASAALQLLEGIRSKLQPLLQLPLEYEKLETIVQKHQHDIRKHIGVEQQLKLYGDSLQQQLEESEKSRNSLLDQTRKMLVALKRQNQKLYAENTQLKQQLKKWDGIAGNIKREASSTKKDNHLRTNSIEDSQRPLQTEYHEKKSTIEKTSPGSNRKHNRSVQSHKHHDNKKAAPTTNSKPNRQRSTSKKQLQTKPPRKREKLKSQKQLTFNDTYLRSSANRSRAEKKPQPPPDRRSMGRQRHFQSHQNQTRFEL